MPEGPEVKAVVQDLRRGIGRRLHSLTFVSGRYHDKSPPVGYDDALRLLPATIVDWNCKGKFIYLVLEPTEESKDITPFDDQGQQPTGNVKANAALDSDVQHSIWITLGMTGRFVSEQAKDTAKHIRWYMEIEGDDTEQGVAGSDASDAATQSPNNKRHRIYYSDMRNFGTLKFVASRQQLEHKLQKQLGPDILSKDIDVTAFLACCDKYGHWNVCKLLMDQTKISGIGNYLLAESLYRASIDPFCTVGSLPVDDQQRLFQTAQQVAQESFQSLLTNTTYEFEFQVYGRATTDQGETVHRDTKGPHGRTIWYTERQLRGDRCSNGSATQRVRSGPSVVLDTVSDLEQVSNTPEISEASAAPHAVPRPKPRASGNSVSRTTRGNAKLATILGNAAEPSTVTPMVARDTVKMTRGNAKLASILATVEPSGISAEPEPPHGDKRRYTSLAAGLLKTIVEPGWKNALTDRLRDLQQFQDVAAMLEAELNAGETVFPPKKEIFAALNLCPLDKLKVVIVGQDPYHGEGQGHGLAFSVRKRVRAPPSLQNIFRELSDSIAIEPPPHGNLEYWARQGVLCLNSVLTVRKGKAYSHARKGWEEVTDLIIQVACESKNDLVFLLWGNAAAEKVKTFVDDSQHTVIRTSHPSPLGATKTKRPFIGSGCFRRTNKALIDAGLDPIDWNVNE